MCIQKVFIVSNFFRVCKHGTWGMMGGRLKKEGLYIYIYIYIYI